MFIEIIGVIASLFDIFMVSPSIIGFPLVVVAVVLYVRHRRAVAERREIEMYEATQDRIHGRVKW